MAESARRGRGAGRPSVEALEGRIVMSSITTGGSLRYVLDSYYVSPQSGTVNLTVSRSSPYAGAIVFRVKTSGDLSTTNEPRTPKGGALRFDHRTVGPVTCVSVGFGATGGRVVSRSVRTTGRDPSFLPITPIDGTYQLQPGQASVTIPVRLNPRYAVPVPGNVTLDVRVAERGSPYPWTAESLSIASSPDQIRPLIVATSLATATGAITLTFSKPMDPATVEDINNYLVTGGYSSPIEMNVKSAAYDPATRTVTLTPTGPLDPALTYSLRTFVPGYVGHDGKPQVIPAKPLKDLQGNTLGLLDPWSVGLTRLSRT